MLTFCVIDVRINLKKGTEVRLCQIEMKHIRCIVQECVSE